MYKHYVSRLNNYKMEIDFINSLHGLSGRTIKIDKETQLFIQKLKKEENMAASKARAVLDIINTAPDETDRRILIARHVQLKSMKDIMEIEGYSRSGLAKRYRRAVNSVHI